MEMEAFSEAWPVGYDGAAGFYHPTRGRDESPKSIHAQDTGVHV